MGAIPGIIFKMYPTPLTIVYIRQVHVVAIGEGGGGQLSSSAHAIFVHAQQGGGFSSIGVPSHLRPDWLDLVTGPRFGAVAGVLKPVLANDIPSVVAILILFHCDEC